MNALNIEDIKTLGICALLMAGLAFYPDALLYAALIVFLIMLAFPKGRSFIASLGFRHQENWLKSIGLVVVGYAAILGLQTLAATLLPDIFAKGKPLYFADIEGNMPLYLYSLISGVIIGGFVEEMLFRGFLLTRLMKIFGNSNLVAFIIVAVTSLIFGFIHVYQGADAAILTLIFSFVAGLIFIRTGGNLWLTILIHSIFNIVTFTVIYLGIAPQS